MTDWQKVKIFYDSMLGSAGSTLSATTTESDNDFDPDYIGNWLEINAWKADLTTTPMYITYDEGPNLGSELLSNIGFETAGGGGADVFADWEIGAVFHDMNEGTIVNSGAHACKLTQGSSLATLVKQNIAATAGDILEFTFNTRGDGTYDGRFRFFDVTNALFITAAISTGITGTVYTEITHRITVPVGSTEVQIIFFPAATDTAVAYFDDCSWKVDSASAEADYMVLYGHNLNTIGATAVLQYSTDNFVSDVNDVFTPEAPTADTAYLKTFSNPGLHRYWRLKITGTLSAAPFLRISAWGLQTELDFASVSFDPNQQDTNANINETQGLFLAGIHVKSIQRRLSIRFTNKAPVLYDKIETWHESHGLKQFFIAWELGNNPSDVWLMRSAPRFNNPLRSTGDNSRRDITLNLTGRKE